jgi:hypothetical protein
MQIGERPRQHAIPAHGVEKSGDGCLHGDPAGGLRRQYARYEQDLQEIAAHRMGNLVDGRLRVAEAGAGMGKFRDVGNHDEECAADERHGQDGASHDFPGIDGFFRQGGNRIETQKGQGGEGGPGHGCRDRDFRPEKGI